MAVIVRAAQRIGQRSSCAIRMTSRANGSSWRLAMRSVRLMTVRRVVDHAAPADVAAHDADDPVVDRFVVDDHLGAGLEQGR